MRVCMNDPSFFNLSANVPSEESDNQQNGLKEGGKSISIQQQKFGVCIRVWGGRPCMYVVSVCVPVCGLVCAMCVYLCVCA